MIEKTDKAMKGKIEEHPHYNTHSYKTKNQLIRENIIWRERYDVYTDKIKRLYKIIEQEQRTIENLECKVDDLNKLINEYKEEINEYQKKIFVKPLQKTYLMKDSHTGMYKIGKSKNPLQRERTLQSQKPTIKMVKCWNKDIENKLHDLYYNCRVRGEWFQLNDIQVKYICTHF